MEEWVSYYNKEQYGFSESFKKELSKQLGERFKYNLECDNLFEKYFFSLFLGMNEIQIREKDGYVFGNAEIISPDSQSRGLTICWKSDFFDQKLEIHKQDVEDKINFFFCSDFPREELKKYIKTKKSLNSDSKKEDDLDFSNFPDLKIQFEINKKFTVKEETEILNVLKRNKNIYISDFKDNQVVLDFQIDTENYNQSLLEKDKDFILESLNIIRNTIFGKKIDKIVVN